MPSEDIVKKVLSKISTIKGVRKALVLTDEDRRKVIELEEEAETHVMMGLGYGENQGIKTALQREVVIAFVTDNNYVWPHGPNLILKWKGQVIGEEVTDPKKLEELKTKNNVVLMGSFALYKDRMPTASNMVKEPSTVIFPPKPCSDIKEIQGICDAVQASPCPPTDTYLKNRMNANLGDPHLGTFMIGFNFTRN